MFNPTFGKPDNIHYIVIVHCSLNLFHFIIYCNNCKQTACNLFTDSKGDEDNVRLHFPTDHRCLFCRQSFKNQIEREKHKKTHLTTGQNPYHCPKCEASFKTMSEHKKFQNDYYLERHVLIEHTQLETITGKYSDDETESVPPKKTRLEKRDSNFVESALSQYMNKNPVSNPSNPASKQNRFTCNLCDKSYTRNSLNAHQKKKHANQNVNSTVNLTTSSANQTKPFTTRKKVKCSDPSCGKIFNQNSGMKRHFNTFNFIQ